MGSFSTAARTCRSTVTSADSSTSNHVGSLWISFTDSRFCAWRVMSPGSNAVRRMNGTPASSRAPQATGNASRQFRHRDGGGGAACGSAPARSAAVGRMRAGKIVSTAGSTMYPAARHSSSPPPAIKPSSAAPRKGVNTDTRNAPAAPRQAVLMGAATCLNTPAQIVRTSRRASARCRTASWR